jgi:hypothetical protein
MNPFRSAVKCSNCPPQAAAVTITADLSVGTSTSIRRSTPTNHDSPSFINPVDLRIQLARLVLSPHLLIPSSAHPRSSSVMGQQDLVQRS